MEKGYICPQGAGASLRAGQRPQRGPRHCKISGSPSEAPALQSQGESGFEQTLSQEGSHRHIQPFLYQSKETSGKGTVCGSGFA